MQAQCQQLASSWPTRAVARTWWAFLVGLVRPRQRGLGVCLEATSTHWNSKGDSPAARGAWCAFRRHPASGVAEAAAECRRLGVSGTDWTAEIWRVVAASNVAEQRWRGATADQATIRPPIKSSP